MGEKLKFTTHMIISTVVFVLLAVWIVTGYKPGDKALLENIVVTQGAIFLLSFVFINHKYLKQIFKQRDYNTKDMRKKANIPGVSEIFLILLAVIGALVLAYVILVYEIDIIYYVAISGLLVIWLAHLFCAFKIYKSSNNALERNE